MIVTITVFIQHDDTILSMSKATESTLSKVSCRF
jgi:hypothetical protein